MKQIRKIVIGILFFLMCYVSYGQSNYSTAFGLRLGLENGLTVKHFVTDRSAFEGLFTTRWRGFVLTGLFQLSENVFTDQMNLYYGIGGHIGFWSDVKNHPVFDDGGARSLIGFDGIIGLEFTFENIPFNVSFDWKPMFNFYEKAGFIFDSFGLSFRFAIK